MGSARPGHPYNEPSLFESPAVDPLTTGMRIAQALQLFPLQTAAAPPTISEISWVIAA